MGRVLSNGCFQGLTHLICFSLWGVGEWGVCVSICIRGVDSSHATWTRVGLESLFL